MQLPKRSALYVGFSALALALAVPASCTSYVSPELDPDATPGAGPTTDASRADAPLLGLEIRNAVLTPAFSPDVFDYTGRAAWSTLGNRVQILVTLADATGKALLRRGDGSSLELGSGVPTNVDLTTGAQEQFSLVVPTRSGSPQVFLISLAADTPHEEVLKADPARVNAYLGQNNAVSVSPDGTLIGVGALSDDPLPPDAGFPRGACTVFERSADGTWTRATRVEGAPNTRAGYAVALSNDTLAVGSLVATVNVYRRNRGAGFDTTSMETLTGSGDLFGSTLAFVGEDMLLVGARLVDAPAPTADGGAGDAGVTDAGGTDAAATDAGARPTDVGAVFVYERGQSGWSPSGLVYAPEPRALARFGQTIVSDGEHVAIGAPYDPGSPPTQGAGSVFVYRAADLRAGAPVALGGAIQDPLPGIDSLFGASVDLAGDLLLVGADGADAKAGRAFVFRREESGYVLEQQLTLPPDHTDAGDRFGFAVAFGGGGTLAYVTAQGEDGSARSSLGNPNEDAQSSGAVFVFERSTERTWTLRNYLKPATTTPSLQFGFGVRALGNSVLAAALYESSGSDGTPDAGRNSGGLYLLQPR